MDGDAQNRSRNTCVCERGSDVSELCKFGVVSTGVHAAGGILVRPRSVVSRRCELEISPVSGAGISALGLGTWDAPAPRYRLRQGRASGLLADAVSCDHSHLACDHSHSTVTDSRRESGSFNTESPYPMRAPPQGPTWWPHVIGGPFLIHRLQTK